MSIDRIVAILTTHKLNASESLSATYTTVIDQTISHLNDLRTVTETRLLNNQPDWLSALRDDFDKLQNLGFWPEDLDSTQTTLQELEAAFASSNSHEITMIPKQDQPLPIQLTDTTLPPELQILLQEAWFLHILATNPGKVVPPGKSLLSVFMSGQRSAEQHSPLHQRVEHAIHDLFWDEATNALSDPLPAIVLQRLKGLYVDLHTALLPLFPANNSILILLSSPLPPTSSPLHSSLIHLEELLAALKQRCAPIRDVDVDAISRPVREFNSISPSAFTTLPKLIVDTIRSVLTLVEIMKDDLNQFVLGSLGEDQLVRAVDIQAKRQERSLIEAISGPKPRLLEELKAWLRLDDVKPSRELTVSRLLEALSSKHPVGCILRTSLDTETQSDITSKNALPSPFLFVTPSLLRSQNLIQAIIITASLQMLVRLPAQDSHDLINRLLTLLNLEVDDEGQSGDESTKLINLADEVVRMMKKHNDSDEAGEIRLREAIDRTLKETDPVFLLLQKRVMVGIGRAFNQCLSPSATPHIVVPPVMQSGIGADRRKPYSSFSWISEPGSFSGGQNEPIAEIKVDSVKGFEDSLLSQAIESVAGQIWRDIYWVQSVWGDLLE